MKNILDYFAKSEYKGANPAYKAISKEFALYRLRSTLKDTLKDTLIGLAASSIIIIGYGTYNNYSRDQETEKWHREYIEKKEKDKIEYIEKEKKRKDSFIAINDRDFETLKASAAERYGYDYNKDGFISRDEYLVLIKDIDTNNDGIATREELYHFVVAEREKDLKKSIEMLLRLNG